MSSSQPFLSSSPISSSAGHRTKSRFTFKHLSQLALSSTTSPLRVIAHIDLDAFYAQCEGVRLGIAEDQPLAVQVLGQQSFRSVRQKLTLSSAMAGPYCHQLPSTQIWLDQVHYNQRGKKAVSGFDYAACRDVERRGYEMGIS